MGYRVLVVDDSKLARMAVAKALATLHPDWTRIEAANADEALALGTKRCVRPRHARLQHAGPRRPAPRGRAAQAQARHAAGGHLRQPPGRNRDAGARGRRDIPAEAADRESAWASSWTTRPIDWPAPGERASQRTRARCPDRAGQYRRQPGRGQPARHGRRAGPCCRCRRSLVSRDTAIATLGETRDQPVWSASTRSSTATSPAARC